MTQLVPSIFRGSAREGDFGWMIDQPEYADSFFLFNDNAEQFESHRRQRAAVEHTCPPGGGNAVIRPHQCRRPPRAAGIPTGAADRGFDTLTPEVEKTIDEAVASAEAGARESGAMRVFYSAADEAGTLGTGIFRVAPEVKDFIVKRLGQAFPG